MAEAALVTLRAATPDDIPAFVALGLAVVPPTYGPIDSVYAQRMIDEWWTPAVFSRSMQTNLHLVAEVGGPSRRIDDVGEQDAHEQLVRVGCDTLAVDERLDLGEDRVGITEPREAVPAVELDELGVGHVVGEEPAALRVDE